VLIALGISAVNAERNAIYVQTGRVWR